MRAITIELTDEARATLESWVSTRLTDKRLSDRAQIILDAVAGVKATDTARKIGVYPYVVSKWRKRFCAQGVAGLYDGVRTGKPATYGPEAEKRVLAVLEEAPPEGAVSWNGRLIAERLGNVSADYVWRVMRKHHIVLQRNARSVEGRTARGGR